MFQFYINQFSLKGDGSGFTSTLPYSLILNVVGGPASSQNIWLKDYDTLADAKTGAAAVFATGTVTPWVDGGGQSVSAVFTVTF